MAAILACGLCSILWMVEHIGASAQESRERHAAPVHIDFKEAESNQVLSTSQDLGDGCRAIWINGTCVVQNHDNTSSAAEPADRCALVQNELHARSHRMHCLSEHDGRTYDAHNPEWTATEVTWRGETTCRGAWWKHMGTGNIAHTYPDECGYCAAPKGDGFPPGPRGTLVDSPSGVIPTTGGFIQGLQVNDSDALCPPGDTCVIGGRFP